MTPDWMVYASTTVASILFNAHEKEEYNFYILSNKFDKKSKNLFNSLKTIHKSKFHFIKIDDKWFDGAVHDWLGVSASYRLKLSSLINEDKILYLDSDIIAFQNIYELYSTDITNYYLAAVEDKCSKMMGTRIGLAEDETFVNSGMQLINLKKFREDNLEELIFDKLKKSTFYTDQDVINDVCRQKILTLPLKYNIMPISYEYQDKKEEYDRAMQAPVLVHYTAKPWNGGAYPEWHKMREMAAKIQEEAIAS
jgi:lipopolysaccharide biosynthesis glycosyltransferase